jgi:hypothetical protein
MTRRFVVRARAERDLQSSFEWYESQQHITGPSSRRPARDRFAIPIRHILAK